MDRRIDMKTAFLVDGAVNAERVGGPGPAARHLAEYGVPIQIALRVLTRPSSRRHYTKDEQAQ